MNFFFGLPSVVVASRLSPVAASGGCSSFLIAVASPVAEPWLESAGSVVVVLGLSCSVACGTFMDQ